MKINLLFKTINILFQDFLNIYNREKNYFNKKPTSAVLTLTYRCDSRCKSCVMWKNIHDDEITKELGLSQWLDIADVLLKRGVGVFELLGGNILLRKDLLVPLLISLHERGANIHMATNQIGLDDEIAQALVSTVNTVYISTDGVDSVQDNIRGIDGSSEIGRLAIQKLNYYRKGVDKDSNCIRVVCNCTVSKYNYDKLDKIAVYAHSMGFDEVHYEYLCEMKNKEIKESMIKDILPTPHFIEQDESLLLNEKQAKKLKKKLKIIHKVYKDTSLNIVTTNIDLLSVENLVKGTIPHDKCYLNNTVVTVDPYGNIVPCPFFTKYLAGNLIESSFEQIWENDKFHNFRKLQNDGKLPMCRQCTLGIVYNNPLLISIKRIYYERLYKKIRF